jgi:hypothetical protein
VSDNEPPPTYHLPGFADLVSAYNDRHATQARHPDDPADNRPGDPAAGTDDHDPDQTETTDNDSTSPAEPLDEVDSFPETLHFERTDTPKHDPIPGADGA